MEINKESVKLTEVCKRIKHNDILIDVSMELHPGKSTACMAETVRERPCCSALWRG